MPKLWAVAPTQSRYPCEKCQCVPRAGSTVGQCWFAERSANCDRSVLSFLYLSDYKCCRECVNWLLRWL